ncbi:hypothetical protein VZ95_17730 [Elstera litoralis]|uniref:thioredoxin-dependent peroxiredoxin n=1 Tax=Elstera litoralis TaxID=552518 RepID=A0A0F3INW4_9PROT|nr:peroxiredoxin-like family protein [Elstera litoralis]KJV08451.1 hypothetical protein VZ95_17730 [Elstera litoralis]
MLDPYARLASAGSLAAALDQLADELTARQMPEARAVFEQLLAWLRSGPLVGQALQVGDQAPGFLLPDYRGRLVSSTELLADGPIVLSFFRGGWCPYCGLEMAALEEALPEISGRARLVGVTPEAGSFPNQTILDNRLSYPLLADLDNGLALAFGLVFRMPQAVIDVYRARGLDLAARQGNDAWMVPVPGTFVIDRAGIIRFAFADPDYRKRVDPGAVIAALTEIET